VRYELVKHVDLPTYLAEIGGEPTSHPAPPGWVYVAVPDLPDAITNIAAHFTIEFIPEET
jgi:hypothetical protein